MMKHVCFWETLEVYSLPESLLLTWETVHTNVSLLSIFAEMNLFTVSSSVSNFYSFLEAAQIIKTIFTLFK